MQRFYNDIPIPDDVIKWVLQDETGPYYVGPEEHIDCTSSNHPKYNNTYPVELASRNSSPVCILISEGKRPKFRYAEQMRHESHGGLQGKLVLPQDVTSCDYQIHLSVVPSSTSKQEIHPCMLHVTVMDPNSKQKRVLFGTELKDSKDWRVVIDVDGGVASYLPNYGANAKMNIDCIKDGNIILGTNYLQVRMK